MNTDDRTPAEVVRDSLAAKLGKQLKSTGATAAEILAVAQNLPELIRARAEDKARAEAKALADGRAKLRTMLASGKRIG